MPNLRSTTAPLLDGAPAVLAALADGVAVSGGELGARLGLTRAAVWKQVARLRGLGLEVDAQPGAGYRLAAPFDRLDGAAIHAALPPALRARMAPPASHWQLDSTSSELLRRASAGAPDLACCLAEVQNAGRGRRGREWRMPLGGGLAMSLLKRFDRGMAALAGLSLVVGIAACEALGDAGIAGVGLKWPNDLVAADAKLGGILVELGGDALGPCHAVIGIGLNLRLGDALIAAIDQPCTDLARLAGAAPARNALAARLLARLVPALERFERDGFAPFASAFAGFDALRGRPVRVIRAGDAGARDGIACGVDARGALRMRFDDGERSIDSGELSVRARA